MVSCLEMRLGIFFLVMLSVAGLSEARTLMTREQALITAFPAGSTVTRETIFLTSDEVRSAAKASGLEMAQQLVVRYRGSRDAEVLGYAYFDTHLVRTLPEVIMVLVTPSGTINRIEILSFSEPMDYFPRPRWIDQFKGRKLDDELSLRRAIRPISGASLTAKAIANASRRVLAIHQTVGKRSSTDRAAPATSLP